RLFGLPFSFRLRLALFEFEAHVFLVGQHEKRFEWPAFARNETLDQIRFAGAKQFLHLFAFHRLLQNDFSGPEVARFVWADRILAHISHPELENTPAAFGTLTKRLLSRKIHGLRRTISLTIRPEIKLGLELVG